LHDRDRGVADGRAHWHPRGEAALLYRRAPQVAWADLDVADRLALPGCAPSHRPDDGTADGTADGPPDGTADGTVLPLLPTEGAAAVGEGAAAYLATDEGGGAAGATAATAAAAAALGRPLGAHELFPSPLHLSSGGLGPCSAADVAWLTVPEIEAAFFTTGFQAS
jgi:hypothetical protein